MSLSIVLTLIFMIPVIALIVRKSEKSFNQFNHGLDSDFCDCLDFFDFS